MPELLLTIIGLVVAYVVIAAVIGFAAWAAYMAVMWLVVHACWVVYRIGAGVDKDRRLNWRA